MAALNSTPVDNEEELELRRKERQRFIKEHRVKPSFWYATTGASLKYAVYMILITFTVIPPAVFYWSFILANIYELNAINEILNHVFLGVTSSVSENDSVSMVSILGPSIDTIGIVLWSLIAIVFAVAGWFIIPFHSPLQKRADEHMMEWSSHDPALNQFRNLSFKPIDETPPPVEPALSVRRKLMAAIRKHSMVSP